MSKVHTMSLSLRVCKDSIAKTAHNAYVKPRPCHALSHRLHFDFGRCLYLEATRLSATTTPLELAALGQGERFLVLVRTHAKVLHRFTRVPLAPQQNRVRTSGCPQGKLVQSQSLSTSIENALLRGSRKAESGNGEFGDLSHTHVVRDGSDLYDDFRREVRYALCLLGNSRQGDGRAVDFGEEQSVEDDLVEVGVCSASQETVEFDEQEQVRILALWGRSDALLDVVGPDVNTHLLLLPVNVYSF